MSRALGIDYGMARVGISISDPLRIIAKPFTTLKNNENLIEELVNIAQAQDVADIIVGYPIGMKGQVTEQTKKVDSFIIQLESKFTIKITKVDERLSSVAATDSLIQQGIKTGINKAMIDDTSAAIILQEFLDSNK